MQTVKEAYWFAYIISSAKPLRFLLLQLVAVHCPTLWTLHARLSPTDKTRFLDPSANRALTIKEPKPNGSHGFGPTFQP